MRFFPQDKRVINCPATKEPLSRLECYFCMSPCIHRENAASLLFIDAQRNPLKYPSWLYKSPPFSRIRRLHDGR